MCHYTQGHTRTCTQTHRRKRKSHPNDLWASIMRRSENPKRNLIVFNSKADEQKKQFKGTFPFVLRIYVTT